MSKVVTRTRRIVFFKNLDIISNIKVKSLKSYFFMFFFKFFTGDDPGLSNQKTPTILLMSPNQTFHSFGFSARDFYHDLDQNEARRWFYFDKFKMILHHNKGTNHLLL